MALVFDITGKRFGKLVVLGKAKDKWLCLCDCGNRKTIYSGALRNGSTKSCGCLYPNLPKGEAAFRLIYLGMLRNAKTRNLSWSLTREQVRVLTKQHCHYCGIEPYQCAKATSHNRLNGSYTYNGLDRIDNTIGYIADNVVPCCGRCNKAKSDMKIEEFKAWIARVHDRFQESA